MYSLGNIDSLIIRKSHKAKFLRKSYSLVQASKKNSNYCPKFSEQREEEQIQHFLTDWRVS